ncbi:hypothetical protein FDP41_011593 [Naegleria fowleri]|uniref:Uncharacterized protein n=1 Tax=Naegleria fowleri TaxID=5763 RepID=A0A6A5BX53_NAEFO|nr:uncharacterized protein FDP41_011593 [Naegleria fowleri]KAF0982663.1 hypothetical protein FDP41_011593 [Naegleria fowleri]
MGSKVSRISGGGAAATPGTWSATFHNNNNNMNAHTVTHSADSLPSSTSSNPMTTENTSNTTSNNHNNNTMTTTCTTDTVSSDILMDEEMYAALINHANLNAPMHLPPSQRVVYSKIKQCILFEDIHNDEYIMERYSMCLSDPKAMLDTYLNLDNTITKQWDERVKLLEQEQFNTATTTITASCMNDQNHQVVTSSCEGHVNGSETHLSTPNEQKAQPTSVTTNAKNMHLFSPQFYELITSAKKSQTILEEEGGDEVKKVLNFDIGLSQLSLSTTDGGNHQVIARVFEDLIHGEDDLKSCPSTPPHSVFTPSNKHLAVDETIQQQQQQQHHSGNISSEKKEVKWSSDIVVTTESPASSTPHKKALNSPSLDIGGPHQPSTIIENDSLIATSPPPSTHVVLSSSTLHTYSTPTQPPPSLSSQQQPFHSTPTPKSNHLTRSSAVTDIPIMNTFEGTSAMVGTSNGGVAISNSELVTNTQNSLTGTLSEEDSLRDWWVSNPTLEKSIKIKLIVTDMHHHNKTKQTIRQIISPLLSPSTILPAFGMFHTALVISEFKLEWTDSSLCIPRKLTSQSSFFSADIEEITTASDLEDIVKKIAQVICRWNSTMIYSERRRKKKKKNSTKSTSLKNYPNTGNCQDFIFDILESIGKKDVLEKLMSSDSPMGHYMRDMRKYGRCSMELKMNHLFRDKFGIKEKVVKFATHRDLDLFVKQLEHVDPDFKHTHKNEWILLKGFDRAFWIRYLAYKDKEELRPLYEKQENVFDMTDLDMSVDDSCMIASSSSNHRYCEILACPFDDPTKSLSIILKP